MEGLVFATVIENSDKDHPGMLKVSVCASDNEERENLWAKILVPYAGNGHSMYFLPEVGDSVVVGFIGEPCTPVVMGCLYSGAGNDVGNETKPIHTKGGHQIIVADEDGSSLEIKTKAGHSITLSDNEKIVKIASSSGKNAVLLDEEKETIDILAGNKVSIKAEEILLEGKTTIKGKTITIGAETELSIKGNSAVKIDGASTKITAQTLEATGHAAAKIESNGILSVKGAMINMN